MKSIRANSIQFLAKRSMSTAPPVPPVEPAFTKVISNLLF